MSRPKPPNHQAWTHTIRGRALDLLSPSPVDVHRDEVATGLSHLCRYAGGVSRFYSVAEHSCLISDWLLEETGDEVLALAGLLHDCGEAYCGDMTWPMQVAIFGASKEGRARYRAIIDGVERAILAHLGYPGLDLADPRVKEADLRILHDEVVLLAPGPEREDHGGPLGVTIEGWLPERARAEWLRRLDELLEGGERG